MSRRWPLAALAAVALALPTVAACDLTSPPRAEDCDREDWRKREDDCGYWSGGRFIPWSWVTPGADSVPPAGWTPTPPRAATPTGRAGSGVTARPPAPRVVPPAPPPPARPPARPAPRR